MFTTFTGDGDILKAIELGHLEDDDMEKDVFEQTLINQQNGFKHQKMAVDSGYWPTYRFNPDNAAKGKNPLTLDYKKPKVSVEEYVYTENRFKMLTKMDPERAKALLKKSQENVDSVWKDYEHMASLDFSDKKED